MPLHSMTGFARADGSGAAWRWTWELRSVNGKGLDVRLRLPPGLEALELPARERVAAKVARGNVQATLTAQQEGGAARIRINEDVLADVIAAMEELRRRMDVQPPTVDGILSMRGVVENGEAEPDEATRRALNEAMLADLDEALADLVAARAREGKALASVLSGRLDELEKLVAVAESSPARQPEAIRAKLAEQVAALLGAAPALDADRLHQEAVLLATRADIREELDRLTAHITAARELLAASAPVGRRFDFLAQEFNREVNTLCAKSNDRGLTATGLDMKAVVDQLREQVQNVE